MNLRLSVASCKFLYWPQQSEVGVLIRNNSREPVKTFGTIGLYVDLNHLKLNAYLIQQGLTRGAMVSRCSF